MVLKKWIQYNFMRILKSKSYVEKTKECKYFKNKYWRAAKKLRLSIYSSRPGIIIEKGADIETLKKDLKYVKSGGI